MRFPNAHAGVKKIFSSEILSLISAAALLLAAVSTFVTLLFADKGGALVTILSGSFTLIAMIGGAVLGVIALIFMIVGVNKATKDEPAFKTAMLFIYISLACAVCSPLLQSYPTITSLLEIVGDIAEFGITIFIIQGIRNLADRLNDGEMSAKGAAIFKAITVMYAIAILSGAVAFISATLAAILGLVEAVVAIVIYIVFLSYLAKAKKMLAK